MATEAVYFKIPKKKVSPLAKGKKEWLRLPEGNRFFWRVKQDRGVLASSVSLNEEEKSELKSRQKVENIQKGESRTVVTRSASMNFQLNKASLKSEHKILPQIQSLPKMSTKHTENGNPRQIIKSELGCFNFYDILKRKQEISQKKARGGHLTRLSSYVSEEEMLLEKQENTQNPEKQLDYEEYDRALMQPEPMIYRQRVFKLKHKAQWSIGRGA